MMDSEYKIPEMRNSMSGKSLYIFLIVPLLVFFYIYVETMNSATPIKWVDYIFSGIFLSFIGNIPVLIVFNIVNEIIAGPGSNRRLKQHWAKHSYVWYRSTFPGHAHANGRVSCRHCGGDKLRVTNLMKQTYMRVHNCAQCGEPLYFTPEKI
ncbi:hypothetical protein [Pseudoduganella aquatica]|uniref:Uncharacterized protein n=1 Tax=Pseudoduganella aquatica TaxID=2660641 RepID=A0A7X4KJ73_9BURK|nr:hypothetical protein [Pseudoduganella aquatica]MYN05754.1 hypothetical protein [Pseudoduganella aquatica]